MHIEKQKLLVDIIFRFCPGNVTVTQLRKNRPDLVNDSGYRFWTTPRIEGMTLNQAGVIALGLPDHAIFQVLTERNNSQRPKAIENAIYYSSSIDELEQRLLKEKIVDLLGEDGVEKVINLLKCFVPYPFTKPFTLDSYFIMCNIDAHRPYLPRFTDEDAIEMLQAALELGILKAKKGFPSMVQYDYSDQAQEKFTRLFARELIEKGLIEEARRVTRNYRERVKSLV